MKTYALAVAALGCAVAPLAVADSVVVDGGATSVALDTQTLADAASLVLSGVSDDVTAPGALEGSVAFDIVDRTSFAYDSDDFLNSFSGSIEHDGSVFFNDGSVEVGDFSIGYDADRAGTLNGAASGFFVESTTGIAAILFDVAAPSALSASDESLSLTADLLVSPEFGGFLADNGLSQGNLAGADVGDAQVNATAGPDPTAIPTPAATVLGLAGLGGMALRRRSRA